MALKLQPASAPKKSGTALLMMPGMRFANKQEKALKERAWARCGSHPAALQAGLRGGFGTGDAASVHG